MPSLNWTGTEMGAHGQALADPSTSSSPYYQDLADTGITELCLDDTSRRKRVPFICHTCDDRACLRISCFRLRFTGTVAVMESSMHAGSVIVQVSKQWWSVTKWYRSGTFIPNRLMWYGAGSSIFVYFSSNVQLSMKTVTWNVDVRHKKGRARLFNI